MYRIQLYEVKFTWPLSIPSRVYTVYGSCPENAEQVAKSNAKNDGWNPSTIISTIVNKLT